MASLLSLTVLLLAFWWWRTSHESEPEDDPRSTSGGAERTGAASSRDSPDDVGAERGHLPWEGKLASVSGTVTSSAGTPIRGAQVCLWLVHERLPTDLAVPRCTTTATDGRYRLANVPPLRFAVDASAAEHVPGRYRPENGERSVAPLQPGEARTNVDVELETGGVEIHGVVMDLAGGVVEGARVWASSTKAKYTPNVRPRVVGTTDVEGRFSLWVEADRLEVVAEAEGYATGKLFGIAPGRTFEVFLTPESVIVGRVFMNGAPVAAATVRIPGSFAISEDDGRFRLAGLQPGQYHPEAFIDAAYGRAPMSISVGLAEVSDPVKIELHPAAGLEGMLVIGSVEGPPCENGAIVLTDRADDGRGYEHSVRAGRVEVPAVRPGTYRVDVECEGYVPNTVDEDLVLASDSRTGLRWVVKEGWAIEGSVRDDDGRALEGVAVFARRPGGGLASAVSAAMGAFVLRGLGPGTYTLMARGDGLVSRTEASQVEIVDRDVSVDLELSRGGALAGRVVDTRGEPVPDAGVRLTDVLDKAGRAVDDGTFRISGIPEGTYRAMVIDGSLTRLHGPDEDDDTARGELVTIIAGETAQVELVVARKDGTIRGRVLDPTGGPVGDAFVSAEREPEGASAAAGSSRLRIRWNEMNKQPVLTDQDGYFELSRLIAGRYTVFAHRRGGGEGLLEQVELGSEVVVTLSDMSDVRGRVVSADASFPDEFTVTLFEPKTSALRGGQFYRTEGRFEFTDVAAGEYEVTVTSTRADGKAMVRVEAGQAVDDLEVELSPRVRVHGRIVDLETGEPVAGMRVLIHPATTPVAISSTTANPNEVTDAEGRFSIEDAPAGPVQVLVMHPDMSLDPYGWTATSADVPPGRDAFELPTLAIVASRVGQGKSAGDLGFRPRDVLPGTDEARAPLEVAFVRPGGPAAKVGLSVGDIIATVDGHDVTGPNRYRFNTLTEVPALRAVELGLAAGGLKRIVAEAP